MNKYNYQFEQCVNSISLINDSTEHQLTTTLNIILKVLNAFCQLRVRPTVSCNSNTSKVCVLNLPGAGAERTHSVAMLYTSALPD